jgi:hypothetical protein
MVSPSLNYLSGPEIEDLTWVGDLILAIFLPHAMETLPTRRVSKIADSAFPDIPAVVDGQRILAWHKQCRVRPVIRARGADLSQNVWSVVAG